MKDSDKPEKPFTFTWWDDIKYGIGAPLLLLSVPLLLIIAIILVLK